MYVSKYQRGPPRGGGTCSLEIDWLVPLFPKNRKFVFLCSLFPNISFVPMFPWNKCPVHQNPWEGLIRVPSPTPLGLVHKVILYSSELSQFPGKVCWLVQALEKSLGDSGQTRFQGSNWNTDGGGGGPIVFFQYKQKKNCDFSGRSGPPPPHTSGSAIANEWHMKSHCWKPQKNIHVDTYWHRVKANWK